MLVAGTSIVIAVAVAWAAEPPQPELLQRACRDAAALRSADLIDEAQRAYAALARAAPGARCRLAQVEPLRPVSEIRAEIDGQQADRAEAFERARTTRRAAALRRPSVSRKTVRRWWRESYAAYLEGLDIDPTTAGARRGLRRLLVVSRPRGRGAPRIHCERARDLLRVRLLKETRGEYVRVLSAGRPDACEDVAGELRTRRLRAYVAAADGRALERSGDPAGARRRYVAALAVDPGSTLALDGLARTPLPALRRPTERLPAQPDRAEPPGGGSSPLSNVRSWVADGLFLLALVAAIVIGGWVVWMRWLRPRIPWVGPPAERVEVFIDGEPNDVQEQAIRRVQELSRQPAVAAAGAVREIHVKSRLPTDFASADVPDTGADVEAIVPGAARARAMVRVANRLARTHVPARAKMVQGNGMVLNVAGVETDIPTGTAEEMAQMIHAAATQGAAA